MASRRASASERLPIQFTVCVRNDDYPASLDVRKLYRVIQDDFAGQHGLIRVIDESGEDYLQNGKPKVVMMGVHDHDRLQDTLALLKLLAQSQDSQRSGRTYSSAEVRRRARTALKKAMDR